MNGYLLHHLPFIAFAVLFLHIGLAVFGVAPCAFVMSLATLWLTQVLDVCLRLHHVHL